MVCDDNTYEAAGKEVEKLLNGISVIKLDPENLHANEIGVAKVKEQLDPIKEVDCMIAVGSGTVHDLTDIMHMKERSHLSQFQPQPV